MARTFTKRFRKGNYDLAKKLLKQSLEQLNQCTSESTETLLEKAILLRYLSEDGIEEERGRQQDLIETAKELLAGFGETTADAEING